MTVQTAVLIETLAELGADVRWVSCNIFSTQDHAAAGVVVGKRGTVANPKGIAVYAWKGESLAEYWWCTEQALMWPDGSGPNLLLDDGGDATLLSTRASSKAASVGLRHRPEEWGVILNLLRSGERISRPLDQGGREARGVGGDHQGAAVRMMRAGTLLSPRSVSTTGRRVQFDNSTAVAQLTDGILRAPTDARQQGRRRLRVRRRRQGAQIAPGPGPGGDHGSTRSRALQAAMGLVTTLDSWKRPTSTSPRREQEHHHHQTHARMKDKAMSNIGHFDNEIDMAGLKTFPGIKRINIKPQYDEWVFPDGHSIMILAEGRLLNLGCATGHPSFVMSASFTNQVMAQIELHTNTSQYDKKVYVLPKHLDEKVARLHLDKLGVKLTQLSKEQADYIGVKPEGPYKPEHYRY
jgi:adenosylhomocysteinase